MTVQPNSQREIILIGIGAGDPSWLTLAAIDAIQAIDVLFVVVKEDEYDELVEARRQLIATHRNSELRIVEIKDPPRPWRTTEDYPKAVATWRRQRQELWTVALSEDLQPGQRGGFLVWGDPSLYESTLAIIDKVVAADEGLTRRVIPGISSPMALAARHGIPLNRQGRGVTIMPARALGDAMPDYLDDVVLMLDPKQTFATIPADGIDIYWGAYLGSPDEILISGPLAEVRDEILQMRAAAQQRKGWIFDIYLLRRRLVEH